MALSSKAKTTRASRRIGQFVKRTALETWAVLRATYRVFSLRGGRVLAGALAFSAVLSVVPLFIIALRIPALVFGQREANAALFRNVARWVGRDLALTIDNWVTESHAASLGTSVVGALALVYGSSRVFATITRAFDMLWAVDDPGDAKWWQKVLGFLTRKLIAFLLVLLVGVMLVGLVFAHTLIGFARSMVLPGRGFHVARFAEYGVSLVTTILLFTLLYRVLPSRPIRLLVALKSAVATAVLFTVGAILLGTYIGRKGADNSYGAATSAIMLLIWIYYAAHVFFFGASMSVVLSAPSDFGLGESAPDPPAPESPTATPPQVAQQQRN
ncbi:MAG: YihY/virulence factor BrkB family protein [Polyangiaceae bacterium]